MEFTAMGVCQIAAGVLLGNLMAFAVLKGAQIIDRDERAEGRSTWWRYFVPVVPVGIAVIVLIGSTAH